MPPRRARGQPLHAIYDVDDVVAAVDAASSHGFLPLGPPTEVDQGPNRGARVVYLRDADGLAVELIQKPR